MARASMTKEEWDAWKMGEIRKATTKLRDLGYALDDEQILIGGERFLQSGKKLVLTGQHMGRKERIIAKWSTDKSGMKEIADEHKKRTLLDALDFSYATMRFPTEVGFIDTEDHVLAITEYIPQDTIFIALPLQKQFFFALSALESQEGVHATTRSHQAAIRGLVETFDADDYLRTYEEYSARIRERTPGDGVFHQLLADGTRFMRERRTTIARYTGFLTHTDFVPHNLRVNGNSIIILDHTSLAFGNKHDSWARFINFMTVFRPDLERLLLDYVRTNRGMDEYESLRSMRLFKAVLLLDFHTAAREKATGDLRTLITTRISLWEKIVAHILRDTPLPGNIIEEYRAASVRLRSKEEKKRHEEISGWSS